MFWLVLASKNVCLRVLLNVFNYRDACTGCCEATQKQAERPTALEEQVRQLSAVHPDVGLLVVESCQVAILRPKDEFKTCSDLKPEVQGWIN